MENVRSQLESLKEDTLGNVNYESWRFKINLALKSMKIYEVATEMDVKPEGEENADAVANWKVKDLEAQTIIGLNCSGSIALKIAKCKSAYSMLSKLDTLYGKKSDVSIEGLQRQFFNYKYNESKSVLENCMQIQQLADCLDAEGEPEKETWIMQRILSILPEKLYHFRTSWDNVSGADRCLTTMFDRLRLEEDRQKENSSTSKSTSQNALISEKKDSRLKMPLTNQMQSIKCFKCGKLGHIKSKCRGKPTAKYIEYCKNTYGCHKCKCKGHFAKECPNEETTKQDDKSGESKRRAYITVSLSSINHVNKNFQDCWYQDCGATQHMSSHKEWFKDYYTLKDPVMVTIGDATEIEGIGVGSIELEAFDGKKWQKIILKNVLYTPKMPFNLFSVSTVLDRGYVQSANAVESVFKDCNGHIGVIAEREGKLFRMKFRRESEKCLASISLRKWHEKLAHQNVVQVRKVLTRKGIKFIDDWDNYVCPGCMYGKQHRVSHPINPKKSTRPLDLIHVDLCEMDVYSLGGAKYFLLFKDDYTHFRTVYFLKNKNETEEKLKVFLKLVENQFGRKVKVIRSDNGTEIKNSNTQRILENLGIFHSKSSAYTPQQNGRIEREMRTVVEAARSAIHGRNLNQNLWAEAVNYVVFTINHTGTSTEKGKSPADLWFGRKLDVNKLNSFGCTCYVLTEDHRRSKTERKSQKGMFVGYDVDSPGFRVLIESINDVVSSSNVIFDDKIEIESFTEIEQSSIEKDFERLREDKSDTSSDYTSFETEESNNEDVQGKEENGQNESGNGSHLQGSQVEDSVRRNLRDRRAIRLPARFQDYDMDSALVAQSLESLITGEVKISVAEAMKDERWKEAMLKEMNVLSKMKTWNLTNKPRNATPLTCRWIFTRKSNGEFKARLVIRGYEQERSTQYPVFFSPVARHVSVRLVLSMAASEGMSIITFDVIAAFLNGDLNEEIYMYQPEGFNDESGRVCKLMKSIYGLNQAPKIWYKRFTDFLKSIGLEPTDDDPCVFYNKDRSIIIVLHVDDGLMIGKDKKEMVKILRKLKAEFKITYHTGEEKCLSYLGMQIEMREDGIFINQSKYTERMLDRFDFKEVRTANTPVEKGMITDGTNYINDRPLGKHKPYKEAVGSLLYLATITRPDINFIVNYLSRYNNKPMKSHWLMVKRVFQYLKGTPKYGIFYNGKAELTLYSDSDYGGDIETGHSTTGVLIMRGGPIVWLTQKQGIVANSTAEAEYRAAVSAIDDICWIRRIAAELNQLDPSKPTIHYIDNQSAIHILDNTHEGKTTKGKKHIEISRKFIQQHIGSTTTPAHVKSADQLADILTKPLPRRIFENLRNKTIKEEC